VVITYDYAALESAEDVQTDDTRWRTKITLTLGIETAREYAQYFSDREKHITAAYAGAAFNDPANRMKTTYFVWYYDYQSVRKTRNTKVERPDGTSSEYSYVDSSRRVYTTGNSYVVYTTQKTTVNKFQGNITSRSIETTDQWGTVEYSRQYAPGEDGRELLVAGFDTTVDEYGRPEALPQRGGKIRPERREPCRADGLYVRQARRGKNIGFQEGSPHAEKGVPSDDVRDKGL